MAISEFIYIQNAISFKCHGLGVVTNEGHKMFSHFFLQGLRVNFAGHKNALATEVKP